MRSMQQDTSAVRRQVVALLPDAPLDERTVQVRSAEGVHQFGVDLITTASEAGFGAVSAPIVADLLAGKPAVVVVQGDDADCGLTLGLAKSLLGLLFDRVAAAPAGVDCELTASCVELTLALTPTPASSPSPNTNPNPNQASCVEATGGLFDLLGDGHAVGLDHAAVDAPAGDAAAALALIGGAVAHRTKSASLGLGHVLVRLRLQTRDVELRGSRTALLQIVVLASEGGDNHPTESASAVPAAGSGLAAAAGGAGAALLAAREAEVPRAVWTNPDPHPDLDPHPHPNHPNHPNPNPKQVPRAVDALLDTLSATDAAAVVAAADASALTRYVWPPPATSDTLCRATLLLVTPC